jgi:hypothetical protein
MRTTIDYINEALRIGTGKNRYKTLGDLWDVIEPEMEKRRLSLHAIAKCKFNTYVIYYANTGLKGAQWDEKNKKLKDYPKPTKAYSSEQQVIKFIEKNWEFSDTFIDWYRGRDEEGVRIGEPEEKKPEPPKTLGDTNLAHCKNAEEVITKLAEYLGLNKYDISSTTVTRYNAQIKGKMLKYRDKEITIYDGTYQGSYGAKGYARKKGFTVRLNIEDTYGYKYTDLDYRLGPQGDDFISWWGRRNETVKSLVERIDKIIDKEKK